MKRSQVCAVMAILSMILPACNVENDAGQLPSKKVVIEIRTPPNFNGDRDSFIIATGPDGTFLGLKEIGNGQTIVLDTAISLLPDKVNITLLTYSPPNTESPTDNFRFHTETDVPSGSTWYYEMAAEGFSGTSFATVNIEHFPAGQFCSISGLDGYASVTKVDDSNSATVTAILLQDPTDLFLSTVGTSSDPRYFKAEVVTNGGVLNLDYQNDFKLFNNVIDVPPDGMFWLVSCRGYNKPVSQILSRDRNTHDFGFFYDNNIQGIRLGFNDGYSSYSTFWYSQGPERAMSFEKWGGPPEHSDFQPIEGDFEIKNEGFNRFDYTTSGTFHYFRTEFRNISSARALLWTRLSPIGSHGRIMNRLPSEILARFPKLADVDLDADLKYESSTFYRTTTQKAIDLYIDRKQSSGKVILEGETWSLQK